MSTPGIDDDRGYLSFVDGLRAVSILAVIGCHVGLPGFSGGYVGVDVFFVISGFLIINQIKDGLESGRFSIASFYTRRILRIVPPFMLMYLTVVLLAPFILATPNISFEFLRSAPLSPLMAINIYFYLRQGYFDIDAYQKPLLHTWTLSVEEQFYLIIPIVLVLIFHLRNRRFGALAVSIGLIVGLLSLAGAIANTSSDGPNAAFYLMHWRMWEFIAGGFIGAPLVAMARRAPRMVLEALGLAGFACIGVAVGFFDSRTLYPSWHAMLPVVGAASLILSGLAQPRIIAARFLALRWMVGIGLVSYAWYLWHWPILVFLRLSRLEAQWLVGDLLGAGLLAFVLAAVSYIFVERPIRRWKKSNVKLQSSNRILAGGVAAGFAAAILGGSGAFGGYLWIDSFVTSKYGTEGNLDNGCKIFSYSEIPSQCLGDNLAMLMGDSLANSLVGSFTRNFNDLGLKLIYMGRGGCDPLFFAPSERQNINQRACAKLLAPFDQLLSKRTNIVSVVMTPRMSDKNSVSLWTELISQFDPSHTRILLLAPSPYFKLPGLDCVSLSDRYGLSRERCTRARSEVEHDLAPIKDILKIVAHNGFDNVRYIDPIDLFCDAETCWPFKGNQVFFDDQQHLLTPGADKVWNSFAKDFRWVAWKE